MTRIVEVGAWAVDLDRLAETFEAGSRVQDESDAIEDRLRACAAAGDAEGVSEALADQGRLLNSDAALPLRIRDAVVERADRPGAVVRITHRVMPSWLLF